MSAAWLVEVMAHGIDDCLGIDLPEAGSSLLIPHEKFHPHDLTRPLNLGRRFDIALCLEVAEHLEAQFADDLVRTLVGLADVVVFSAAIPFQTGAHHVNERWPDYWWERFRVHGYRASDPVRLHLWDDPEVVWWYAQNLVTYTAEGVTLPGTEPLSGPPLSLVHPACYLVGQIGTLPSGTQAET